MVYNKFCFELMQTKSFRQHYTEEELEKAFKIFLNYLNNIKELSVLWRIKGPIPKKTKIPKRDSRS